MVVRPRIQFPKSGSAVSLATPEWVLSLHKVWFVLTMWSKSSSKHSCLYFLVADCCLHVRAPGPPLMEHVTSAVLRQNNDPYRTFSPLSHAVCECVPSQVLRATRSHAQKCSRSRVHGLTLITTEAESRPPMHLCAGKQRCGSPQPTARGGVGVGFTGVSRVWV